MKLRKNIYFLVLLFVALIGFVVRLLLALYKPLSLDEVLTFYISNYSFRDLFLQSGLYWDFSHPPLFYLIIHTLKLFSANEFWMKIPSLLSYLISLIVLKKITDFFKSNISKLLVFLYFSSHYLLIDLQYELRMYSLVILLLLSTVYFIFKILLHDSNKDNSLDFIYLSFFAILSFYVDYAGLWLIGSLFFLTFYLWLLKDKKFINFFKASLVTFLGIIPQLLIIFLNFGNIKNLNAHLKDYFIVKSIVRNISLLSGFTQLDYIGLLMFLLVLVFLVILFFKNKKTNVINLYLLISCYLPVITSLVFSFFFTPMFIARNLVFVATVLIVSIGFISDYYPRYRFIFVIFFILMLLNNNLNFRYDFSKGFNDRYNEQLIRSQVGSDECQILYYGGEAQFGEFEVMMNYYLNQDINFKNKINVFNNYEQLEQFFLKTNKDDCYLIFDQEAKTFKNGLKPADVVSEK